MRSRGWAACRSRPTRLHLTQPAVSIQIAALEESAGTPLLQRTGRGIRLTEAGELLAGYAGRILDLWREAGDEMATLQGVFSGTLRVGAVTTAEYLLPPLLVAFANEHPKVKVKLQVGNRDEIVRMLAGPGDRHRDHGPPARRAEDRCRRAFAKPPDGVSRRTAPPADVGAASSTLAEVSGRAHPGARARLGHAHDGRALLQGPRAAAAHRLRAVEQRGDQAACARPASASPSCRCTPACSRSNAGLLALLPLADNPIERDWYVMHLASRQLPHVALAFEEFLCNEGQAEIQRQLGPMPAARKRSARRA